MAASEDTLNKIHTFFAEYLLTLLEQPEDMKTGWITAAELGVIAKFLKDNNISFTGAGEDDKELEQFRERARKAALDHGFTRQDIEESIEGLEFRQH